MEFQGKERKNTMENSRRVVKVLMEFQGSRISVILNRGRHGLFLEKPMTEESVHIIVYKTET